MKISRIFFTDGHLFKSDFSLRKIERINVMYLVEKLHFKEIDPENNADL